MTGSEARADRVLVAMSGGVDSSAAAKLLRDAGYACTGCTMKLYRNEDAGVSPNRTCCSLEDIEDARSAAFRLGSPYYVFNFTEEFREKVIGKFVASYCRGLTPNPCIDCNRYLKFGALFQRADLLGCRYVATGHYARIDVQEGKYRLRKAADESKDQSYVLYMLTQEQLARTLFPLGELRKEEVRNLAEAAGLGNARKPDSQDICFVPDRDYARVIERHTGKAAEPGNFVSPDGTVLGQHRGLIRYTVGQHRGLGLSQPERRCVCRLCPENNTVVLGSEQELYRRDAVAEDFHWIAGEAPAAPLRCRVKLRYRQREQPAEVTPLDRNSVYIRFDEPQRAITPGQAAVLYDGDTVLGGGSIMREES